MLATGTLATHDPAPNSYDADAAEVIVHGENLDDPDRGQIIVTDTGCGMTRDQFVTGFLRVASRLKEQGTRRSTVFGRRYTGETDGDRIELYIVGQSPDSLVRIHKFSPPWGPVPQVRPLRPDRGR